MSRVLVTLFAGFLLTAGMVRSMAGSEVNQQAIEYCIIVTGGELLQGKYPDSHTQFITRVLNPFGFRCLTSITVGDRADDLRRALYYASRRASLILVTGGLGPTKDDITRSVLSDFSGVPLVENKEVIARLEERFVVEPGGLRENLHRQAQTPVSGTYLPNPNGTAVGLVFEKDGRIVVALPGPPLELRPMLADELAPLLVRRFGTRTPGSSVQMRFVGIGESSIDKAIEDHLNLPKEVEVSSLFEAGRVDLTISLPGGDPDAMDQLKHLEKRLLEEIGEYMYSDDGATLEECVLEMMAGRDITLGLAEVGSGGAVSASLNDLGSSRKVIKGGLIATSNAQLDSMIFADGHNSTGTEPDGDRVSRLCHRLRSSWGLIVTEPKVAEDGQRSVEIVLGDTKGTLNKRTLPMRGQGENARSWLVSAALDLLRRSLDKM